MSIMNLGKYTDILDAMQVAIKTESAEESSQGDVAESSWKSSRAGKKAGQLNGLLPTQPEVLSEGDGILRTVNIAMEVVHHNVNAFTLNASPDIWFDGKNYRTLAPNLQIVQNVLFKIIEMLDPANSNFINRYKCLLATSDLNENKCMSRFNGDSFMHLSSQMSIIDNCSMVHAVTMDRLQVTKHSQAQTHYVWRAVLVRNEYELSIKQIDSSGRASYTPANEYIEIGDSKLGVFSRTFQEVPTPPDVEIEYAYRLMKK